MSSDKKPLSAQMTAVELWVVGGTGEETEAIVSALRHGGLPVHHQWIADGTTLSSVQIHTPPEIIVLLTQGTPLLPAPILKLSHGEIGSVLILGIEEPLDKTWALGVLRQGVRDLVPRHDLERLKIVIHRELQDLRQRRSNDILEGRVHEAEQRWMTALENTQDAVAFVQDGMHLEANALYLELFGYSREDIEGLPLLDLIVSADSLRLRTALRDFQRSGPDAGNLDLAVQCMRFDQTPFPATLTLTRTVIDGELSLKIRVTPANAPTLVVPVAVVAALPVAAAPPVKAPPVAVAPSPVRQTSPLPDSTALPLSDTITLPDRRADAMPDRKVLTQRLETLLANPRQQSGGIILICIFLDSFSELRRTLGIGITDWVVKEIGHLIQTLKSPQDLVSEFGDQVFMLLCHPAVSATAESLAERILAAVRNHRSTYAPKLAGLTCSIGIAQAETATAAQDLLNSAYFTAQELHDRGGNRYEQYRLPGHDNLSDSDRHIRQLIQKALAEDRFRLVYQPIVSLQGDSRENYAVMLRLLNERDEELTPDVFMEQAIANGQMTPIDRWVIRHAIAELATQNQNGGKMNFFIIVSEPSLRDSSLLLWIVDCLRETKARGGWITFQLREAYARDHMDEAKILLEAMKKLRCNTALDHFGALPNPEILLKNLPLDFVKLEPSLIQGLSKSQEKQKAIRAINEFTKSYGVKTIAVSVEDANSLAILWTLGVGYTQGYFLHGPSESISY
ncbi:MAG: EAL domain-containing protein [Pseudomonadota bacterium]